MDVQAPDKLRFLLESKSRYKVAYGGRGAGKSWAFADALLARAIEKPTRILCTRELQKSIKDSVHRLLHDRIKYHKLGETFEVTDHEIRRRDGESLFIFLGLRSHVDEIKSLEGIDIAWLEEAQRAKAKSLELLIPTIRKDDSEIWASFNTGQEVDPIYKMFVVGKRPNSMVVKINWRDNPWFPYVLRQEMEHDREHNPERYNHVWEGEPGAEGTFFVEFGDHLKTVSRQLEPSEMEGRLFGSLDGGTTHPTSFGLWHIDYSGNLDRLFSYEVADLSHAEHAIEIYNKTEAFSWTLGTFPDRVYADPSMWTKVRLREEQPRSPIDEYIDLFRDKNKHTAFVKANNDKENGCQLMRLMFKGMDNVPMVTYWDGYNKSFENGILRVETDDNNAEVYAKQNGDDVADESRYGMVAGFSMANTLKRRIKREKPKTHLQRLLAGEYAKKQEAGDWYYD